MRPSFFQSVRFPASIGVVFLSLFLFGQARTVWRKYWLLRDGQQSTALVTWKYGHELVDYSFRANGKEYKGTDREKYVSQEHRYEDVTLGGEAVVYFSTSHPWLSSLARPDSILPDGFLGVIVFLVFDILLIRLLIDPDSKNVYADPRRAAASGPST